jgi:hypothetical protein
MTVARFNALRTVGNYRVIHQNIPGTDRTRYTYYRSYTSQERTPSTWITIPRPTLSALVALGLVEHGPRIDGGNEFSDWHEPVTLTKNGRKVLAGELDDLEGP